MGGSGCGKFCPLGMFPGIKCDRLSPLFGQTQPLWHTKATRHIKLKHILHFYKHNFFLENWEVGTMLIAHMSPLNPKTIFYSFRASLNR